ncbi:uncharacterized protein LOC124922277 [Impatiens glandulifera]|uniref:uncharacterized protein LOC124922277 n=1 Tax=Impatiens glandulifera TaxID=253017 RepID=UPI001FB162B7|nr:uncharacterized protein LOC124922277 [Impatiens glandulifera]
MEKYLKPYDKEFMKMAMLKHEETFKQQVYELHRLYQIQKALMRSMASQNQEGCRYIKTKPRLDHQINQNMSTLQGFRDQLDDTMELDYNRVLEIEDESQIELTLGPTSFNKSTKRVETKTRTSESGRSFSSSTSTGSSHMKNFGTTRINERRREELSFDSGEELNQSKIKHDYPPWLFQSLTLNLT